MKKLTSRKKPELRTLSVRVPRDLYESLEAFRRELQAFDDTMVLDVNELVAVALKRDLRVAREELEHLKRGALKSPPGRPSTVNPTAVAASGPVPELALTAAPGVAPAPTSNPISNPPQAAPAPTSNPISNPSRTAPGRSESPPAVAPRPPAPPPRQQPR